MTQTDIEYSSIDSYCSHLWRGNSILAIETTNTAIAPDLSKPWDHIANVGAIAVR